ncbi:MAG: hypothetical protein M1831_005703 [Alyxoria varia]|nr:MAG: hypothetical protein M1831_005703 [Alyxoria varia]
MTSTINLSNNLYPTPTKEALRKRFVGKSIRDVEAPAAVIDLAVASHNCYCMTQATEDLDIHFRAHVKTHKTAELTQFQVSNFAGKARIVVSTVVEVEHLLPLIQAQQSIGREFDVLYGVPPSSTCFARLKRVRDTEHGPSISFLVDHPLQLQNIVDTGASDPTLVFIKIDAGYHRAGVELDSAEFASLLQALSGYARSKRIQLRGFYVHMGNSYSGNSPVEALRFLEAELNSAREAVRLATEGGFNCGQDGGFTISVGASPTATSLQNLFNPVVAHDTPEVAEAAADVKTLIEKLKKDVDVEVHAGVYTLLDMQQLATHARPSLAPPIRSRDGPLDHIMDESNLAFTILAEVLSVYPQDRTGKQEALISAGSLALGREPCKSYDGWGVLARVVDADSEKIPPARRSLTENNWVVGRISQEHGILTWVGDENSTVDGEKQMQLHVGDRVLVYPNHACIAGAGFGWYLVVDSGAEGMPVSDKIVDVCKLTSSTALVLV